MAAISLIGLNVQECYLAFISNKNYVLIIKKEEAIDWVVKIQSSNILKVGFAELQQTPLTLRDIKESFVLEGRHWELERFIIWIILKLFDKSSSLS